MKHNGRLALAVLSAVILVVGGAAIVAVGESADAQTNPGYNDGTYYAESDPDARGRQALIEITVLNGTIVSVHYDEVERDADGQVVMSKLYSYSYADGWRAGRDADTTQLSAFPAYVNQLIETGDLEQVDVISGATSSHENFLEVAGEALEKARR